MLSPILVRLRQRREVTEQATQVVVLAEDDPALGRGEHRPEAVSVPALFDRGATDAEVAEATPLRLVHEEVGHALPAPGDTVDAAVTQADQVVDPAEARPDTVAA